MGVYLERWIKDRLNMFDKLNLSQKIDYSKDIITRFYETMKGKVFIAFSGGKDSIVLLHLVRTIYPDVKAVYNYKGTEYPNIWESIQKVENILLLRLENTFDYFIKCYGYCLFSKTISKAIWFTRHYKDNNNYKHLSLNISPCYLSKKYHFLLDAPFEINHACCNFLIGKALSTFINTYNLYAFNGERASESLNRRLITQKKGYYSLGKYPVCKPIQFWSDQDVFDYAKIHNLDLPIQYKYGFKQIGCAYCLIGIQFLDNPKFKFLKEFYPDLYKKGKEQYGLDRIIKYCQKHIETIDY